MPEPANMVAIYCSIGKSTFAEINTDKMCQCNKCPVLSENNLSTRYYCRLGKEG